MILGHCKQHSSCFNSVLDALMNGFDHVIRYGNN